MMKGNEIDCICEKPKGKHRGYCDAYRLSEFFKKITNKTRDIYGDAIADKLMAKTEEGR